MTNKKEDTTLKDAVDELARNTQVELPDWQKRMLDEYNELNEKINNLEVFIHTTKFYQLSLLERTLLEKQFDTMQEYLEYLGYRLDFYHIEH